MNYTPPEQQYQQELMNQIQVTNTDKNYVCSRDDLNKKLNDTLKREFQSLFYDISSDGTRTPRKDAWRMFYNGETPEHFFSTLGVDFENPTVRAAVSVDLVKLQDEENEPSISNDWEYTSNEHIWYSPLEWERFILHRNYRVNLVNLEPEWCKITFTDTDKSVRRRTVDRMYQGVQLSKTILEYFKTIFDKCFDGNDVTISDIYIPFTNANDIDIQVSLVPNARFVDFPYQFTRSYYDDKYIKQKQYMNELGIDMISSFALVDVNDDKTHTGQFLVKLMRKTGETFEYIVAKIDHNGQLVKDEDGNLEIKLSTSTKNTILCVCESDFFNEQNWDESNDYWGDGDDVKKQINVVKGTTSSHFSVFRQRIPEYEIRYVRNYVQYKTRLRGMELYLKYIDRDIQRKVVQSSQCFIQQTFAIQNLFNTFAKNKDVIELILQYYRLTKEYNDLVEKESILQTLIQDKSKLLSELIDEYNSIPYTELDRKFNLGDKINSIKLELDKNLKLSLDGLRKRIDEITTEINEVNEKIGSGVGIQFKLSEQELIEFRNNFNENINKFNESVNKTKEQKKKLLDDLIDTRFDLSETSEITHTVRFDDNIPEQSKRNVKLQDVDITNMRNLLIWVDLWTGYMFNLGYEINQLRRMRVICQDATTKVRRLLHNFKTKIEKTRNGIWDDKYQLKPDIDFNDIDIAGIRDIILLYDWYAANPDGLQYQDFGFETDAELSQFRMICNETSLDLRLNKYAILLDQRKNRLHKLLNDILERNGSKYYLKYHDKYGLDGRIKDEDDKWDISKVTKEQFERILIFSDAYQSLREKNDSEQNINVREVVEQAKSNIGKFVAAQDQYDNNVNLVNEYIQDLKKMRERTLGYLKSIGIIETDKDFDNLLTRNLANRFDGDIDAELKHVETTKKELDFAIGKMNQHRNNIQYILDRIYHTEDTIEQLKAQNGSIVNKCSGLNDKHLKNRLLIEKINNEQKIIELTEIVTTTKKENLEDFSTLEKLRNEVDVCQNKYDTAVEKFKNNIGFNQESLNNLVVKIYNMYQDEILKED